MLPELGFCLPPTFFSGECAFVCATCGIFLCVGVFLYSVVALASDALPTSVLKDAFIVFPIALDAVISFVVA